MLRSICITLFLGFVPGWRAQNVTVGFINKTDLYFDSLRTVGGTYRSLNPNSITEVRQVKGIETDTGFPLIDGMCYAGGRLYPIRRIAPFCGTEMYTATEGNFIMELRLCEDEETGKKYISATFPN